MKPTNSLVTDEAAQENPMNRYSLLAPMFAEAPGLTFICTCLSRLKMFQFVLGHSYSSAPVPRTHPNNLTVVQASIHRYQFSGVTETRRQLKLAQSWRILLQQWRGLDKNIIFIPSNTWNTKHEWFSDLNEQPFKHSSVPENIEICQSLEKNHLRCLMMMIHIVMSDSDDNVSRGDSYNVLHW